MTADAMQNPLHILLVEDNEGDVEMTERALQSITPPCHLTVVNNGQEALDLLLRRGRYAEAVTPQLILIDLNMPRMDAKRFLERVKQEPGLGAIPIIVLTSSQSPTDIRECYERHASCYVVKPFDGKEFMSAIKQIANFWGSLAQLA